MNVRLFVLLGTAAIALVVAVALGVGGREADDETIAYRGERYAGSVLATGAEVRRAGAVATTEQLGGRRVFAERRTPPRVLFLLRPDGRYDAYVLARRLG
jgi:hypothetical protein